MPIYHIMKLNVLALYLCFFMLSACTLDLSVRGGDLSSNLAPEDEIITEVLSVDFRAKADNSEISEIYLSKDKTQFDFMTSIEGYAEAFAADPDFAGRGYVMVLKNPSSPASWADKSLWTVTAKAEGVQHYVDLPAGLQYCKVFPHKSSINLHCRDVDYEPVSYQIAKNSKVITPLLSKLGYVDDSNYRFKIELIRSQDESRDLIEVRKIARADSSDSKLVDLYIHMNDSYRKIAIGASDLTAIEGANVGDVWKRISDVLVMTSFKASTQEHNILFIDVSNPAAISLTRFFAGTDWFSLQGVMDGALILDVSGTLKAYRSGSGLVDLSISSNGSFNIANNRVYFNTPWVFGEPQDFIACDIDGGCQTIISDVGSFDVLTIANEQQKKIYFVNKTVPEADRVIESVDTVTKAMAIETDLGAKLAARSIPVSKLTGLERDGNYLVAYYENPNTGKESYAILDPETGDYLDSFVSYCSGTIEEKQEFVLKNHKYLAPLHQGLNLLESSFGCM